MATHLEVAGLTHSGSGTISQVPFSSIFSWENGSRYPSCSRCPLLRSSFRGMWGYIPHMKRFATSQSSQLPQFSNITVRLKVAEIQQIHGYIPIGYLTVQPLVRLAPKNRRLRSGICCSHICVSCGNNPELSEPNGMPLDTPLLGALKDANDSFCWRGRSCM